MPTPTAASGTSARANLSLTGEGVLLPPPLVLPPRHGGDAPGLDLMASQIDVQVLTIKTLLVAQSCLTPSDPMDCSPPDSSVHGIFQARVLEWGAIAFSILVRGCIPGSPGESGLVSRGSQGLRSPLESRRAPQERNGYPLQCSCLENAMDRGVWWATVHGVTKSQT